MIWRKKTLFRRYRYQRKPKSFLLALILIVAVGLISNINKEVISENSYITTNGLNVREGIGTKYPISFALDEGEKVEVISKYKTWFKINYNGEIGYVHSKYLKEYNDEKDPSLPIGNFKEILVVAIVIFLSVLLSYYSVLYYKKFKNTKLLNTVTDLNRGTVSERDLVLRLLKYGISSEHIFHDLLISKPDGKFSQIDLVLITNVGLIVFEVKDYSGWIYGNGDQTTWTQVLAYGKQKYRFQNPIQQNSRHILSLQNNLSDKNIPTFSVIVFAGECVLKNINFVPKQTFITKYTRVLEVVDTITESNPNYEYANKNQIIETLREGSMKGGDLNTQTQHIANVRDMLGIDRILD